MRIRWAVGDDPIEQLPSASRVTYGAVRVSDGNDVYWLKSVKTFKVSNTVRNHLLIRVPNNGGATARYVAESLADAPAARSFTLIFFGLEPPNYPQAESPSE